MKKIQLLVNQFIIEHRNDIFLYIYILIINILSVDTFMMYTISIFFIINEYLKFNFHKAYLFFIFNLFLYAKNHSVKFISYCILMSDNFFF